MWAQTKRNVEVRSYALVCFSISLMIIATGTVMAPSPDAPAGEESMADAFASAWGAPEPDLRTVGVTPQQAVLYVNAQPMPGEPPDAYRTPPWFAPDVDPAAETGSLDLFVAARLTDSPAFRGQYLAVLRDPATTAGQRARLLAVVGFETACVWFMEQRVASFPAAARTAVTEARERCDTEPVTDVAELVTCARTEADEYSRNACFEELIRVDRARAAALIPELRGGAGRSMLSHTLDLLEATPSLAPLLEQAAALGAPGDGVQPDFVSFALQDVMLANGRGLWFDVETGTFPNHHDGLLYQIARLAGDALAEATFIETAPDPEGRMPYALVAYFRGRAWSVSAQNQGDWYDVETVVGLVNTMLRDTGSDVRVFFVATEDQTASLLAGPEAAMRAAAARGELALVGLTPSTTP